MVSAGISSCRDRTSEYRSLVETLKKIGGVSSAPSGSHIDSSSNNNNNSTTLNRSEFNKNASRIGFGIHETSLKIGRLEKLAKKSSLFDDPLKEIQQLTSVISDDIASLNIAVSDLQTLQNMMVADGNYSEDRAVHLTAVFDDLKNKLMGATKQFQDVLTTRTKNIKAHESRKRIFSTNVARENPLRQQPNAIAEPPPWASSNSSGSSQTSESVLNAAQVGSQLRRRLAADSPSQQMEMSMLQQAAPQQEDFTQSRAVALHNVESTISELSGIFTNLASMVVHQGELAIRIDDNMDETLTHVEGARSSLLKHLNRISSNRGLLIKIFAILIFFLMVFIFFLA
ncbi:syntaxin-31 [Apium graveolens]|uniref:syntaxin-31 n=1 Tax=Apium graveolens TaxID=4045 RepID=UPI003D79E5EC